MTEPTLPPLPEIDKSWMIGYEAIRYIPGYPEIYVTEYATAYGQECARAATLAERERCAKVLDEVAADALARSAMRERQGYAAIAADIRKG